MPGVSIRASAFAIYPCQPRPMRCDTRWERTCRSSVWCLIGMIVSSLVHLSLVVAVGLILELNYTGWGAEEIDFCLEATVPAVLKRIASNLCLRMLRVFGSSDAYRVTLRPPAEAIGGLCLTDIEFAASRYVLPEPYPSQSRCHDHSGMALLHG